MNRKVRSTWGFARILLITSAISRALSLGEPGKRDERLILFAQTRHIDAHQLEMRADRRAIRRLTGLPTIRLVRRAPREEPQANSP